MEGCRGAYPSCPETCNLSVKHHSHLGSSQSNGIPIPTSFLPAPFSPTIHTAFLEQTSGSNSHYCTAENKRKLYPRTLTRSGLGQMATRHRLGRRRKREPRLLHLSAESPHESHFTSQPSRPQLQNISICPAMLQS